jgi:hypothetical protein
MIARSTDDEAFCRTVDAIVSGAFGLHQPQSAFVVKVDSWFGPKWLRFSHKVMGAFGVASDDLVVPPFVPARIVEQIFLTRQGEDYRVSDHEPVHVSQSSEDNASRKLSRLFPQTAFFWWSGSTIKNARGCLMAYLPSEGGHQSWYAEFKKADRWTVAQVRGTNRDELAAITTAGAAAGQLRLAADENLAPLGFRS